MTRYAVMGMIVLCGGLLGRAQEPAEPAPPTRMQQVVQVLVADAETGWHGQYGRTPDTVILSWRTFAELGPLEGKFKLLDIQVRGVEAVELPGGMSCDPQQLRDNPAAFVEQVLVLSFDDRALTFGVQPPDEAEPTQFVGIPTRFDRLTGEITGEGDVGPWRVKLYAVAGVRLEQDLADLVTGFYRQSYVVLGNLTATFGAEGQSVVVKAAFGARRAGVDTNKPWEWEPRPPADSGWRIAGASGQVEIQPRDDDAWRRGGPDTVLHVGDRIRTAQDSSATLTLPDAASLTLAPGSELVIRGPVPGAGVLGQVAEQLDLVGKARVAVRPLLKDAALQIKTKLGWARVDGTQFVCEQREDAFTVKVLEGTVSVTAAATGKDLSLAAGQMVRVTRGGLGPRLAFDPRKEAANWPDPADLPPEPGDGDRPPAEPRPSFAGVWDSNFGRMTLRVRGAEVEGEYAHDDGRIEGTLSADGRTLMGTWAEGPTFRAPRDAGRMRLTLSEDGTSFRGEWGYGEEERGDAWSGERPKGPAAEAP